MIRAVFNHMLNHSDKRELRNFCQTDIYQNASGLKPNLLLKNYLKTIRQAPALVSAIIRFATKYHENRTYQILTCFDGDTFAQKQTDDILKSMRRDNKRMDVLESVSANAEM